MPLDESLPKKPRQSLAGSLNTLFASPSFATWRQGTMLDVAERMSTDRERPSALVRMAHLDDERGPVLGVLLEEVVLWVRSLPGSQRPTGWVIF